MSSISLLAILALSSLVASTTIIVPAANTRFTGRFRLNEAGGIQFDHPGTSFSLYVTGTSQIVVNLTQIGTNSLIVDNHLNDNQEYPHCFEVFVDGKLILLDSTTNHSFCTTQWQSNIPISLVLVEGLDESLEYLVEVFKSSEAQFNSIAPAPNYMTLNDISLIGSSPISSVPDSPKRKIEFLGDSITAGYCNLCEKTSLSGVYAESHLKSWPPKIAQAAQAEFHSIAWSGYGLVNNCCGGDIPMPVIYSRSLATDDMSSWNFSSWIPDTVVINLGTNDIGSGQYNIKVFSETYLELIQNMTTVYGEDVVFFLACGPMSSLYCRGVLSTIENFNAQYDQPRAYFLDQSYPNVTLGCCSHPTTSDDSIMADAGAAFIMSTMGWD